jgi:hypothetical protein
MNRIIRGGLFNLDLADNNRASRCHAGHAYRLPHFAVLCRALQLAGKLGWSDHRFVSALEVLHGAAMNELIAWIASDTFASRRRAPLMALLLGLPFVHALVGCGGNSNDPSRMSAPPAEAASAPQDARQGRYVGTVKIGGVDYYGDALITADGLIRLYIGGPNVSDGTVQPAIPTASAQLFGTMAQPTGDLDGGDLIFGQGCSAPVAPPMTFCSAPAHAKHNVAIVSGNIQGEIDVTSPDIGTWTLELSPWVNYYNLPATQEALVGHYKEELADFAQDGDTVISIDADGNLTFQSPGSGCTGDGRLKPHLDGSVNVYDVLFLTISGCQPPYDYLNAQFSGLATTSPSAAWDYDVLLRMWLSQTNPDIWDSAPPALTMSGRALVGP